MKFRIARSRFLEGLKSVQNIVAGKGTLPILNNVMLTAVGGELTMTTTDLDISITSAAAWAFRSRAWWNAKSVRRVRRHCR